jgi:transcription initiation factor TFIID subunit TAF12
VLRKGVNDSSLLSTVGSVSFQIHSKSNETENVTTTPKSHLENQTFTSSETAGHGMSTVQPILDHENQTFSQNQENQTVTFSSDAENQTVTLTDLPSLEINTNDFSNMDNKKAYDNCVRSFQLTRIQHSQDFSSTFLLQVSIMLIIDMLIII